MVGTPIGYAVLGGGKLDPVVAGWLARGANPTSKSLYAQNRMVKHWRQAGYLAKVAHFNFQCGSNLATQLIPLIQGAAPGNAVNTNFVSADYSEAAGLTGNASSKYLDIGTTTGTLLGGSVATGGMGLYTLAPVSSGGTGRRAMGSTGASDGYTIGQSSADEAVFQWGGTNFLVYTGHALAAGCHHMDRSSSTSLIYYYRGSSVATRAVATTPAGNGQNVYVSAINSSGSPGSYSAFPLAGYWVCQTMTAAEALDFAQSIQDAQAWLGRAV